MVDLKIINELHDIFYDVDVNRIEIQNGEDKLIVSFSDKVNVNKHYTKKETKKEEAVLEEEKSNIIEIKSKWVGFYTKINQKNGENYFKLGDEITKGDLIAHVRVLGVLQDIYSEYDGKVKEILIDEGEPIEFGQPILRLEI